MDKKAQRPQPSLLNGVPMVGGSTYQLTLNGNAGPWIISFEINLKTTDFKRNSSGITRIYEYTPPN